MTKPASRLVVSFAVVLAGALTTTACLHPRLPLPIRAPASTPTPHPRPTSALLQGRLFTVTVDIEPASVGTNIIHMYAKLPDGRAASVVQWRVAAANPAAGAQPITVSVLAITPDHAVAQLEMPTAGLWRLTFTLRSKTDEDLVSTDVPIG